MNVGLNSKVQSVAAAAAAVVGTLLCVCVCSCRVLLVYRDSQETQDCRYVPSRLPPRSTCSPHWT